MRILVSAFDLVDGDLDDPLQHPIALALKANTGDVWWIEEYEAWRLDPEQEDMILQLPWEARQAVHLLRCNAEVDAFEFEFRELGPDSYSLEPPRWQKPPHETVTNPFQSELPFESPKSLAKTSS